MRERSIEFFLRKKEEGPYWPSIFKDKKKVHWLKIDFNRWRDEDDSEPEENGGEESQDLDEVSGVRFADEKIKNNKNVVNSTCGHLLTFYKIVFILDDASHGWFEQRRWWSDGLERSWRQRG